MAHDTGEMADRQVLRVLQVGDIQKFERYIMVNNDAFLREQAFGKRADAFATVELKSQQHAVKHLHSILADKRAARLIFGPRSCGRSTIIRQFVAGLPEEMARAVVDGSKLKPQELLSEILAQFGYKLELQSVDELLRMIQVFAVQQTRVSQSPVLVVENIDRMYPATLRVLSLLAAFEFQSRFAIRIVLAGNQRAPQLLQSDGMAPISQRTVTVFAVMPLSRAESMRYLHGRLETCGIERPDQVLPMHVCDRLHGISNGLPGALNDNARGAMSFATRLPVSERDVERQKRALKEKAGRTVAPETKRPSVPKLIVTSDGETLDEFEIRQKKTLVGRSSLADITIYNQFASKMHALFMLYSDALVIVDLNSANGTFVNSVKVNSTILKSNDIISLANHRIKVVDAPAADTGVLDDVTTSDTAEMKTLDQQRSEKKGAFPLFEVGRKTKG